MLLRLSIRDFAVVAHAELAFGTGLTVISGETGAGKSLLVDALGFLSGARADAGAVRFGAQRAELSAEFSLADSPEAEHWLHATALDDGDACLLRRVLHADGGSRAWINGRPVALAQLAELAGLLVEVHGQHAQQALLVRARQTTLLDACIRQPGLLENTRTTAERWKALHEERCTLLARGDVGERQRWLQFQLEELDAQPLSPDALTGLDTSHRRHAHAAALIAVCDDALEALSGETAIGIRVQRLRHGLQREATHEARLIDVDALLDSASIQLDEATSLLQRIRDDLDLDPDALAELERQLTRVQDLARKHRVTPEQLQSQRDALADELESLADADARLRRLEADIAAAHAAWTQAAARLSAARRDTGTRMSEAVTALIADLGMQGGVFEIQLDANPDSQHDSQHDPQPDPNGSERAEFLVSANPGQPPRPLRKIASGGELSRISLAIEVATQGQDAVPTMVFDEVDAGIGGAVAAAVGAKLRQLGIARQVLCVTHQPQVAAAGHAQYGVNKAASDGITQSSVVALDDASRIEEIARMLGGSDVSDEARAAARRLLAAH